MRWTRESRVHRALRALTKRLNLRLLVDGYKGVGPEGGAAVRKWVVTLPTHKNQTKDYTLESDTPHETLKKMGYSTYRLMELDEAAAEFCWIYPPVPDRLKERATRRDRLVKMDSVKFNMVLARTGKSVKRVAIDARINRSTVYSAISGRGVRPATLAHIASALGVDVSEIVVDAEQGARG